MARRRETLLSGLHDSFSEGSGGLMKAAVYRRYGSPDDVLEIREIPQPEPGPGEVLVKVHACSLNSWDYDLLRGRPFIARMGGLLRPRFKVLGSDISGKIVSIGEGVTKFKSGDDVFGDQTVGNWGGLAEFVSVKEDNIILKPPSLTHLEAASLPQAGCLAYQGLNDHKKVEMGMKVLINGGGGGVGSFAIQIAKMYGAEVTAVDNEKKLSLMRSMGADHVMDYRKEDFTRNGECYDMILDTIGTRSLWKYRRSLKENGKSILVGGRIPLLLTTAIFGTMGNRKVELLFHKANKDLDKLTSLVVDGSITPVIDGPYPLDEIKIAFKRFPEGDVQGKAVIEMI
jgi:NADPH:quinone reductase-like Zn-dependent oxidoreductase